LVINLNPFGKIDETEQLFDRAFGLNVKGYLLAAQAFAVRVAKEQQGPSILCIGSSNFLSAEKNSVINDSTKGAILKMVRSLEVSFADSNITAKGVGPGIVETPLTQKGLEHSDTRKTLFGQIPLGRLLILLFN